MTTVQIILICLTVGVCVHTACKTAEAIAKQKYGHSDLIDEPTQDQVEESIKENAKQSEPDLVTEIMKAIDDGV